MPLNHDEVGRMAAIFVKPTVPGRYEARGVRAFGASWVRRTLRPAAVNDRDRPLSSVKVTPGHHVLIERAYAPATAGHRPRRPRRDALAQ
jgi:hypothetical protein